MNRYLLLIILSSWAHVVPLSLQCETGKAFPKQVLNIARSLMNNADVALLKTYKTETLDKCITDCCAEKFGSCSVASFKHGNVTEGSCQHFNCQPVSKCIFQSSNSTDTFSFSSSPLPHNLVPSKQASKNDSLLSTTASFSTDKPDDATPLQNKQEDVFRKESVATYSQEQSAFKDDNTTVKPRKGVEFLITDSFGNETKSGIKPRKGVSLEEVSSSNNTKSKVKPRKGVGPYQSHSTPLSTEITEALIHHTESSMKIESSVTSSSNSNAHKDIIVDDVVSALEKVFEDDTKVKDVEPSMSSFTEATVKSIQTTSAFIHSITPSYSSIYSSFSPEESASSLLQSSFTTSVIIPSSVQTPDLVTASVIPTKSSTQYTMPLTNAPSILEHSKLLFQEDSVKSDSQSKESEDSEDDSETESERKYKSSMHLVLSLVFGLLVLFVVLGVVAKRVYDGWMRRHYRRMDFLIDGMYNGYG